MTKDELVNSLQKRDPLLANAVSNMVDYISDRFPAAYPSKEQTEAVMTVMPYRNHSGRQARKTSLIL